MSASQCFIGAAGSTQYGYGYDVELLSGAVPNCRISAQAYAADEILDCGGVGAGGEAVNGTPQTGTYTQLSDEFTTGVEAVAIEVSILCNTTAGPFSVRFDDAFLGTGLVPVELQSFDAN